MNRTVSSKTTIGSSKWLWLAVLLVAAPAHAQAPTEGAHADGLAPHPARAQAERTGSEPSERRADETTHVPLLESFGHGVDDSRDISHEFFGHRHGELEAPIEGRGPSLAEVLSWADEHAPLVRVARGEIGVAEAQQLGATIRVPDNPALGFAVGGRSADGVTRPEFSVAIQQPFWINGSRRERLSLAEAAESLAHAELDVVRWQVHVEAHRLYVRAQIARRYVVRAKAMLEHADAHRRIAQRKVELGEEARPMLLIPESSYARSRAFVLEAERAEEQARIELAGWIGWPDDSVAPLPVHAAPRPSLPSSDTLLALMAESHPSLAAREAAVKASQARAELARSERTPTPRLGAQYGIENEPAGVRHVWRMTGEIPLPVAHRNQEERARSEAETETERARLGLETRRLRTALMSTLASLARYEAEVELYEDSVMPQLDENLTLLIRAFELGEIDIHEVAAVHEQVLDATHEYLGALERYYDAVAELEGLVGSELLDVHENPALRQDEDANGHPADQNGETE